MKHTESALDADSYEWLEAKNEKLLAAIEADVRQGATPEEIFKLVMRRKDNRKLALICEQAARYVAGLAAPDDADDPWKGPTSGRNSPEGDWLHQNAIALRGPQDETRG